MSQLTSTTTSLLPIESGMQLAWTGVIRSKPILEVAESTHGDSSGVRPSHARELEEGILLRTLPPAVASQYVCLNFPSWKFDRYLCFGNLNALNPRSEIKQPWHLTHHDILKFDVLKQAGFRQLQAQRLPAVRSRITGLLNRFEPAKGYPPAMIP